MGMTQTVENDRHHLYLKAPYHCRPHKVSLTVFYLPQTRLKVLRSDYLCGMNRERITLHRLQNNAVFECFECFQILLAKKDVSDHLSLTPFLNTLERSLKKVHPQINLSINFCLELI